MERHICPIEGESEESLKPGDKIKIMGNASGHRFDVGDVVEVVNIRDQDVKAKGKSASWYIKYEDFIKVC